MRSDTMRPAPLCPGPFASGVLLPVSRKEPAGAPSSTALRTTSQELGASCHSSTSTGGVILVMRSGSATKTSRSRSRSRATTLPARRRQVSVLPTPFGPSRAMAGSSGSSSSSSLSITLSEYSIAPMLQIRRFKRYRFAGRMPKGAVPIGTAPRHASIGQLTICWTSGSLRFSVVTHTDSETTFFSAGFSPFDAATISSTVFLPMP